MKNIRTLLGIASFVLGATSFLQALTVGNTPPDFTATDIAGTEHTLSKLKGSVVLLDFWATWCPPCRVEVPHLIDIQQRFGRRKFVLISISLDRDLEAARRFVKGKGMDWIHIIDRQAGQELAEKYEVSYIPSTFVIDSGGKITATQLRGSSLKDKIATLLR